MKAFTRVVAVFAVWGAATFSGMANHARAQNIFQRRQQQHHVHYAGCGHSANGFHYGAVPTYYNQDSYSAPIAPTTYTATPVSTAPPVRRVPRTNPGNPFPVNQIYGNAYGLGGTGYRPFGSVYSGYSSGAGWGYGISR